MMPKPMRLARCAASFNCGTAGTYAFDSTTSSRKRVDSTTLWRSNSQSTVPRPCSSNGPQCSLRLTDPKQQFSYGPSHCSPHGFVASRGYKCGTGLLLFDASKNNTPGSPL